MVRNRLRRRLRALLATRLPLLPGSAALVVRALPGAGELDSPALGAALDAALGVSSGRDGTRTPTVVRS